MANLTLSVGEKTIDRARDAAQAGGDTLYSEALNAGEIVDGVTIVNPFTKKIDC